MKRTKVWQDVIDASMQTAITQFRLHAPGWYEWRTFRRALRLMVIIRAVIRARYHTMLMHGQFDWTLRCVSEDGSITITAQMVDAMDSMWRAVFHVYDPVKFAPASMDETGWIVTTDPHWLLASGQLDYRMAWRQVDNIFDMLCATQPPQARLEKFR